MKLKNDLLLRAARGEKTERTPVWVMRQAGRILPEYREVRASVSGFKELVESPDLASAVTLQPVDYLGVDAAIIFSDILVIPEAMGLPYEMVENRGPSFNQTVSRASDLKKLHVIKSGEIGYVQEAIRLTKTKLAGAIPLIGFAGAPWTILAYMVEGKGSKTFGQAKKFLYTEPKTAHALLEMITQSTIQYLNDQVDAGADIIQVFDSWAGILSPRQYDEFAIPYLAQICEGVRRVPKIIFPKGAFFARKVLAKLDCQVIGLDWNMPVAESRELIGHEKTLQGNLDPCVLYADDATIVKETESMLREFGPTRHIANLGHGVYPDMEKEKVKLFIDTVRNFRFSPVGAETQVTY